jgi:hypothetical protein
MAEAKAVERAAARVPVKELKLAATLATAMAEA